MTPSLGMTKLYIRTLLEELLEQDLDNRAGDDPSDAALDAQLNEAIRKVSTDVRPVRRLQLAYTTDQPTVDLDAHSPRIWAVHQLQVGAAKLVDHRGEQRLYSYAQLALDMPNFEAGGTAGTPTHAAQLGTTLYLYPKPVAALTIMAVADAYFDDVPEAAEAEMDMPHELAEAVAYHAAVLAGESRKHMPHQTERLNDARARADDLALKWRLKFDEQRKALGVSA